jgi:hypothetical protein
MTVIIDGVGAAPAGLVRRTLDTRELPAGPADTRIRVLKGS